MSFKQKRLTYFHISLTIVYHDSINNYLEIEHKNLVFVSRPTKQFILHNPINVVFAKTDGIKWHCFLLIICMPNKFHFIFLLNCHCIVI